MFLLCEIPRPPFIFNSHSAVLLFRIRPTNRIKREEWVVAERAVIIEYFRRGNPVTSHNLRHIVTAPEREDSWRHSVYVLRTEIN